MVLFRLLQGVFGAALVPLSQAVMLDSYTPARARESDGDLGHGRDDGADHGPLARRLADRDLFLALGVLRQPAVRHLYRARPHHLHGRDEEGPRAALRLVRLHRARDRHRLAAARARPRRAARLAGIQRDHRRVHHIGHRLVLFPGAFPDHAAPVHPVRAVQGQEFRRRLRVHGCHGPGAVLDHGAVVALPAERDRLSDHHGRSSAGEPRLRHVRGDDAGRPHDALYRGADADHLRPQHDLHVAVLHDRLDRPDRRDRDRGRSAWSRALASAWCSFRSRRWRS